MVVVDITENSSGDRLHIRHVLMALNVDTDATMLHDATYNEWARSRKIELPAEPGGIRNVQLWLSVGHCAKLNLFRLDALVNGQQVSQERSGFHKTGPMLGKAKPRRTFAFILGETGSKFGQRLLNGFQPNRPQVDMYFTCFLQIGHLVVIRNSRTELIMRFDDGVKKGAL